MKGTPLIIIDPRENELVRYAKYHLQLRPGTNVAVLNMMAYFIVEAGLIDKDFLNQRCEEVENYLEQIKQLDIAEMERVTGVDADLVRRVAVEYASAPCAMSFHGLGVTEHSQGSKTVMLIANLAMLTGNVGRPGVGVNPLRGQNNVQGAADMGAQPHQGAGYFDVTLAEHQEMYSRAYGRPISDNIGYTIPQMFEAAHERKLKALWIMRENVVQTDPTRMPSFGPWKAWNSWSSRSSL